MDNKDKRDEILEKLNKMQIDDILQLRDKKILELRDLHKSYHKYKDEYLVLKHDLEAEMVRDNLKESEIQRRLRRDENLFKLKKLISEYTYLIKEKKLEIEICKDVYWRNK